MFPPLDVCDSILLLICILNIVSATLIKNNDKEKKHDFTGRKKPMNPMATCLHLLKEYFKSYLLPTAYLHQGLLKLNMLSRYQCVDVCLCPISSTCN